MNTRLIFFSLSTLTAVIVNSLFLYMVYESGKRHGKYLSNFTLYSHAKWVNRFLLMTIVTVLMVEGMIQTKYDWEGVTHLFDTTIGIVHAVCDVVYTLGLVCMRFVYTGINAPVLHRHLFKIVLMSYVSVVATGTWLMVKLVF